MKEDILVIIYSETLIGSGEDITAKGIYVPPTAVSMASSSPSSPPEFEWRQKKKSRSRYMNNLDNLKYAPMEDVHLKQTLEEALEGKEEKEEVGVKEEKMEGVEVSEALSDGSDVDFDNMFGDEEPQGVNEAEEISGGAEAKGDSVAEENVGRGIVELKKMGGGGVIGKLKVNLKRKGMSGLVRESEEMTQVDEKEGVNIDDSCEKFGMKENEKSVDVHENMESAVEVSSSDDDDDDDDDDDGIDSITESIVGTHESIPVGEEEEPQAEGDLTVDNIAVKPGTEPSVVELVEDGDIIPEQLESLAAAASETPMPKASNIGLEEPVVGGPSELGGDSKAPELQEGHADVGRNMTNNKRKKTDEGLPVEESAAKRPRADTANVSRTAWFPQPRAGGVDEGNSGGASAEAMEALKELDDVDIDALVEIERKMIDIEEMPKPRRYRGKVGKEPESALDDLQRKLRVEEKLLEDNVNKLARQQNEVDFTALKEEIQLLLTAFGIPWVDAPCEAEAQCVELVHNGLADGVISDDSDTVMYGADVVLRRLYFDAMYVEMYSSSRMPDRLRDRDAMVSLAMLLGCDYTPGVLGIGSVNAMEIIEAGYVGIERLMHLRVWASALVSEDPKEIESPIPGEEAFDSMQLRQFKRDHGGYRSTWTFPKDFPRQDVWEALSCPVVDESREAFSWEKPDAHEIEQLMCKYTDMSEESVDQLLRPVLEKEKSTMIQRRITDYFLPKYDRGRVVDVRSKRMQRAVKGLAKAKKEPIELGDDDDDEP